MATDMERELERTTDLRGFRYGLHDFIAQVRGVDVLTVASIVVLLLLGIGIAGALGSPPGGTGV